MLILWLLLCTLGLNLINMERISAAKWCEMQKWVVAFSAHMMTSSNGNIFRVIGPLWEEFTGEFPAQSPVKRKFDVFFDLRLGKNSRRRWFDTASRSLWRKCNVIISTSRVELIRRLFASILAPGELSRCNAYIWNEACWWIVVHVNDDPSRGNVLYGEEMPN